MKYENQTRDLQCDNENLNGIVTLLVLGCLTVLIPQTRMVGCDYYTVMLSDLTMAFTILKNVICDESIPLKLVLLICIY